MASLIVTDNGVYLAQPRNLNGLAIEFEEPGQYIKFHEKNEFIVGLLGSRGVSVSGREYRGSPVGRAEFRVSLPFYRDRLYPDLMKQAQVDMSGFLGEEFYEGEILVFNSSGTASDTKIRWPKIDTSSDIVKSTAKRIQDELPEGKKENPYYLVEGIVYWIRNNIEYMGSHPNILQEFIRAIDSLPDDERCNPRSILSRTMFKNIENMENLDKVRLPTIKDSRELAKEFVEQLIEHNMYSLMFYVAPEEGGSEVIKSRAGKCSGINNAFTSLARSLGVPTREIKGHALGKFVGPHAWSVSYMHPYGWVEVDPTFGQVGEDFDCDTHAYLFLEDGRNLPKLRYGKIKS